MIKKVLPRLASLILIICIFSITASADAEYHWYIKRNGTNCPYFPAEASILDDHNGYYIDKTASDNKDKILYLTFDAGYENGNVEKILDTMADEGVRGAFFLLDNIILNNTDLVIRMAEEGHAVCNHTKNHKNLSKSCYEEIAKDLASLEDIYKAKTGREMDKFFRFPEGKYSEEALKSIDQLGYKTIFWSFAYDDWDNSRQMDCQKAIKKILDNTHPGAVILLHPTSSTNAEILPTLIKEWKSMGYSFGTLYELVEK
jgi:peptidoglycan-N-acetylmuramic acid deacetylase